MGADSETVGDFSGETATLTRQTERTARRRYTTGHGESHRHWRNLLPRERSEGVEALVSTASWCGCHTRRLRGTPVAAGGWPHSVRAIPRRHLVLRPSGPGLDD